MNWLKSQKYSPPETITISAKKIKQLKEQKYRQIDELIREWKAPNDPVEEWHHALADLVESYDLMQLVDDQPHRNDFEKALKNARKLLVDD